MGLLDQVIGGVLGSRDSADGPSSPLMLALTALLSSTRGTPGELGGLLGSSTAPSAGSAGGLENIVDALTRTGHGDIAQSWIGHGDNRSIEPHQLGAALGPDRVSSLSEQTGLPRGDLLNELAQYLPQVVDRLTPHGRIPDPYIS